MIGRFVIPSLCLALMLAPGVLPRAAAEDAAPADQDAPARDLPVIPAYSPVEPNFDRIEPLPVELTDVDVVEKLGEYIDLDITFTDTAGRQVKLSDYIDGRVPVVLNITYFRCPMSCPIILQNLAMTLRELELEPGADYRVITVSIDPTDTVAEALRQQREALDVVGAVKPITGDAWPFLVGPAANSKALADAVGYGFKYLPGPRQYTHQDVLIVLSPEGKVTRYLFGRSVPPMTLQLSLVEASQGRIGTTLDAVRLFCFYYTGDSRYALAAMRLMTAGGAVTVITLAAVLALLWLREARKNRREALAQ